MDIERDRPVGWWTREREREVERERGMDGWMDGRVDR